MRGLDVLGGEGAWPEENVPPGDIIPPEGDEDDEGVTGLEEPEEGAEERERRTEAGRSLPNESRFVSPPEREVIVGVGMDWGNEKGSG